MNKDLIIYYLSTEPVKYGDYIKIIDDFEIRKIKSDEIPDGMVEKSMSVNSYQAGDAVPVMRIFNMKIHTITDENISHARSLETSLYEGYKYIKILWNHTWVTWGRVKGAVVKGDILIEKI